MKYASRINQINPFKVMDVLRRARQLEAEGRKIVHMEVGEPDFVTAAPIIKAAEVALQKGLTHYSNAAGIPELREAISGFYETDYGLSVDPRQIFITPGASGGLNLLANLLINPGDGILMADPAYPCNRNYIRLSGGDAQLVPVTADSHFQPTVTLLQQHQKSHTRGLWLASPANPTGTILDAGQLSELITWADQQQLHVVVDEIYHGLHYVESMPSLLQFSQDGFVVNSFSKYFGMTGWRLGWIVVPESCVSMVEILSQNLFIAAPSLSQYAALAAFAPATRDILEQRRSQFRQRRDFLTGALQEIGFTVPHVTDGAFYIYAGIENFSEDSETFCRDVLEHHGVALTPGSDFGDFRASQSVRFAFTTTKEDLELGAERLQKALSD